MKSELTQIREGAIKVRNWKIVVMILTLLLVQAVLGRMDSEAQLAEAERLAALHPSASAGLKAEVEGQAKPPVALQRQASINRLGGGVL